MVRKSLRLPLLLLAVLGLVALSWWLFKPKARFTYGLQPISQDTAILLTRRNTNDATYFWVEHVASNGELLWSKEVSPFDTAEALGFSGVAANEEQVILLGDGPPGTGMLMALARTTGETLWESTIESTAYRSRIGRMLLIDGPRIYVFYEESGEEGMDGLVSAVSLADGQFLWTHRMRDVSPSYTPILLGPGRLLLPHDPGQLLEVEGVTGNKRQTHPLHRVGCEVPEGIVGYANRKVHLVPRTGTPKHLPFADNTYPTWTGPCGMRYGSEGSEGSDDSDVIVGFDGGDQTFGLVSLPTSGGAPRWQIELGEGGLHPGMSSQTGVYPRFLPVAGETKAGTELVVVDLDRGRIVSRDLVSLRPSVFIGAGRAYVLTFDSHLYALSPTDGSLEKVTHLGLPSRDTQPEDYQFGTLWLKGAGWQTPDRLSWVHMELASGEIHARPPLVLSDRTANGWKAPE